MLSSIGKMKIYFRDQKHALWFIIHFWPLKDWLDIVKKIVRFVLRIYELYFVLVADKYLIYKTLWFNELLAGEFFIPN